jgi:parallel beta-helix repeat protein
MKARSVATVLGTVAGATLAVGAGPAFAATLYVHQPTDTHCAASSPYTTIQSAVNAANSGDAIEVCPGTYTEQVTIPAGKNNLRLDALVPLQAKIQAPATFAAGPAQAIVDVNGAQNTTISQFTITGPFAGSCGNNDQGVRVDSGGSANITGNRITQISDSPLDGCQQGVAIEIGEDNPPTDDTTGSATITQNVIDNYQKNGITVDGSGSAGWIVGNVIKGVGPTAIIAQNGIQISDGANASVVGNQVSGDVYTPQTYGSTGMLLYQPGNATISLNNVTGTDTGIYAYQVGGHTTVSDNQVSGSTYDGITLDTSTGGQFVNNNSSNNTGTYGEGFGVYGTTGAYLNNNEADNNATDGFYADSGSSGNTFYSGEAHGNGSSDCEDESTGNGTAGTADNWIRNQGLTSQPQGLCTGGRGNGHGGHRHGWWHPFPASWR